MTPTRTTGKTTSSPAREVTRGVWEIKQPLQNAMRYVWAYAVEAPDGVLLVDAGLDDDQHLANIEHALRLFGATLGDVIGAIFTHYHRDHYGLAERLRGLSGAWLALHESEAAFITANARKPVDVPAVASWFNRLGTPAKCRDDLVELSVAIETRNRASTEPDRLLRDGEPFDAAGEVFEIVHTPGHSLGHVCIVSPTRRAVFSGDHVLSRTTPNVGIFPGHEGSPLADYLQSLERARRLDGLLDLPGHETRIEIGARAVELIDYHTEQLDLVERYVRDGSDTVWEIAERLWPDGRLATIDRWLALGEAYAHAVVLVEQERLELVATEPLSWRTT